VREKFPHRRRVAAFEGGALYTAEKDGKYWVIVDEGTMRDFLSEKDAEGIEFVKTVPFETAEERDRYLRKRFGVELVRRGFEQEGRTISQESRLSRRLRRDQESVL